jgi:hypothetical protein
MTMDDEMSNHYSTTWFTLFLDTIDPAQTEREVAFIARWLPRPEYTTVGGTRARWPDAATG